MFCLSQRSACCIYLFPAKTRCCNNEASRLPSWLFWKSLWHVRVFRLRTVRGEFRTGINYEDVENDARLKIRHAHILIELLDSLKHEARDARWTAAAQPDRSLFVRRGSNGCQHFSQLATQSFRCLLLPLSDFVCALATFWIRPSLGFKPQNNCKPLKVEYYRKIPKTTFPSQTQNQPGIAD